MSGLLVHEWLENTGGAEKVFEAMMDAFPGAYIEVLWNDVPKKYQSQLISESWLAATPLRRRKELALPFMLPTWRRLKKRTDVDWMLISSHLFAHHARMSGLNLDVKKFVYAHTPARYIWEPGNDTRGTSPIARAASTILKPIDRKRAQEAYSVAANSNYVRERIYKAWGIDSKVIYPPIEVAKVRENGFGTSFSEQEMQTLNSLPDNFILGASRFVPYKKLEEVILLGSKAGLPVVIAGSGPSRVTLQNLANSVKVPVLIVESPSDLLFANLLRLAYVLIFPAVEDFGIIPLEAHALGTPVIGPTSGGLTETVVDGKTGYLVDFNSDFELLNAIDQIGTINPDDCRARAETFDRPVFDKSIVKWVEE